MVKTHNMPAYGLILSALLIYAASAAGSQNNEAVVCTANPVLSPNVPLGVTPDYGYFGVNANNAAAQYAQRCGAATEITLIRFRVNRDPQGYVCLEEPCYLKMKAPGDIDYSDFLTHAEAAEQSPIPSNYMDIIEYLEAGDFTYLKSSDPLFRVTYESFITAYSDHCSVHISDPVARSIAVIETTHQNQRGTARRIGIDKRYAPYFDDYFQGNEAFRRTSILGALFSGQSALDAADIHISNMEKVERYVQGRCTNDNVLKTYSNFYTVAQKH